MSRTVYDGSQSLSSLIRLWIQVGIPPARLHDYLTQQIRSGRIYVGPPLPPAFHLHHSHEAVRIVTPDGLSQDGEHSTAFYRINGPLLLGPAPPTLREQAAIDAMCLNEAPQTAPAVTANA